MEEEQNVQMVSEKSISGAAEDPAPETVPETDSASAEAPAGDDGNDLERILAKLHLDTFYDQGFARSIDQAIRTMYRAEEITVKKQQIPRDAVRDRLRMLTIDHIDFIEAQLGNRCDPVTCGENYLISCLFRLFDGGFRGLCGGVRSGGSGCSGGSGGGLSDVCQLHAAERAPPPVSASIAFVMTSALAGYAPDPYAAFRGERIRRNAYTQTSRSGVSEREGI